MTKNLNSTIQSIDLEKGEIIINKTDPNQKYDYVCQKKYYEQYLSKEELINLKEGDWVSFKGVKINNYFYAKEVKIINNDEKLIAYSTIKIIDRANKRIIINRCDDTYDNDFVCGGSYVEESLIKTLNEGDDVRFEYSINNGKYFAKNIVKLDKKQNAKENTDTKLVVKNTLEFTKQFIEQLKLNLKYITDSKDFEDFTFLIFKLLGISEIYAIPKDKAAGRSDGIFKVSNISNNTPKLEVIYDCTLCDNWEAYTKQRQISNYKDQICKNNISIEYVFREEHTTKPIKTSILFNNNSEKQIWIVTKNVTRIVEKSSVEISGEETLILVKEINILDLINVLESKLLDTKYIKIDDIADKLKHI